MTDKSLDEIQKYMGLINNGLKNEIDDSPSDNSVDIVNQNKTLKMQNQELLKKLNELNQNFNLPLEKIAKKIPELNGSIEALFLKYAEDLVIQKSFIELSLTLGKRCGINKDEIFKMAAEIELNVLDNKHNPSHNTVASNTPIINQRIPQLKQISYRKVVSLRGK